jgi:putative transposase
MPRPSRQAVLGDGNCVVHLTIRGHNQQFLFRDQEVKEWIYRLLLVHKVLLHIKIFHYCFMDNHIHLVLFTQSTEALSTFMQRVFGALARLVNRREKRSGRVFGERARTPVIQEGRHFLTVMRYVDLNPVRAGLVAKPHHYRWSSYRHYAYGEADELIDEAPEYEGLSCNPVLRRKHYRELVGCSPQLAVRRQPEMTSWFFIGDKDWVVMMCVKRGFMRLKKPPE